MYEKRPGPFKPNEFSSEFWNELTQAILKAKSDQLQRFPAAPLVAVFDADGTLWDCDMGENFFDYQIRNCNLSEMPEDPWKYYDEGKAKDPKHAYLWLAQINKGQSFKTVQKWAEEAVRSRPDGLPIFKSQRRLIEFLKMQDFQVYIVTASVRWAVIPPAKHLEIDADHVLGIQTKIVEGIVTEKQEGPLTWREGKAEAVKTIANGHPPLFCAGNTTGDLALLKEATAVRLAVRSRSNAGDLERSENELAKIATQEKWFTHEF